MVVEKPNTPFALHDVILDEIWPNEVLVQGKYTGICHTVGSAILCAEEITLL